MSNNEGSGQDFLVDGIVLNSFDLVQRDLAVLVMLTAVWDVVRVLVVAAVVFQRRFGNLSQHNVW